MKRVLALLYFGVLAMGSIYAQGIEFFHGTYEEALQKARAEGKQFFVDVYTSWCGPCKMMAPAVEKLAEEYEGKAVIGKLDVEESMDIAGRYGVMNVPTLILFKDGRAVERKVGLQSASDLRKLLDSVL